MKYIVYVMSIMSAYTFGTQQTVETIYGTCTIDNPLICELLQSHAFNRLKGVNQYGIAHYVRPSLHPYTRYTHSLGVFMLLRMYGASELEQIAGLLHDVSHTVFSHVGDHLVCTKDMAFDQSQEAYQDEKHLAILAQTDIAEILARHHVSLESINHKSGDFHILESELPDICADRLEYNLYGCFIEGWLTVDDIHTILQSLHYKDNRWFFDDVVQAKKLALLSIKLCKECLAAPFNVGSYNPTAEALMIAVDKDIITFNDILFAQDDPMLAQLTQTNDPDIKLLMQQALQPYDSYIQSHDNSHDFSYIGKFRGLNPWVMINGECKRLTEIDPEFETYYNQTRQEIRTKKYYRRR